MNSTVNHVFSGERRSLFPCGFDICLIGHTTRDIIRVGQTIRATSGGTAYYTSMALRRLGLKVAVVTKVVESDKASLLRELSMNEIAIFWKESKTTSVFENTYG